jgi:hypothetical protein
MRARRNNGRKKHIKGEKERLVMDRRNTQGNIEASKKQEEESKNGRN